MEHMDTLNREVNITLHDGITIEKIPHLFKIYGCQCLLLVPGRPPLCLRCNRVGHVRRQCKTPRCYKCGRYGHISDTCVTTYASKLLGPRTHEADDNSELLMDVTELVDASGHTPPNATFEKRTTQEPSNATPDTSASMDDPGGFSEPSPRPDEDDASSTSSVSTVVRVDTKGKEIHEETVAEPAVIVPTTEGSGPSEVPEVAEVLRPTNSAPADEVPLKRSKKDRQPAGTRHKPYTKQRANLKGIEDSHSDNLSTP